MAKKIIFVTPPLSKEELYKNLADAGNELPPLGIATLAAVTRQAGYETKIIDSQALKLTPKQVVDSVLKYEPDYVGITAVTISIFKAADLAKRIKEKNKDMKIILGGPHVTAVPVETMKLFKDFDVAVFGEGEETLLELLAAFDNSKSIDNIKGLILRKDSKIVMTEKRPYIKDLDKLPFPAWDLLPDLLKYYQPPADALYRSPSTLLITSRGCYGQCVFCDRSVFGTTLRCFSADYTIRMIKHLQKEYGIKDVFIEDDNFLVFRKRLEEFCHRIINEKIDISWSCMGRVDNVDFKILKLAKRAHCWQVNYGCESGSQEILNILNKRTKVENIRKAIVMTRKAGMKVKGLFMMGNFGETKKTAMETINFIKSVPMTDFHITCFTPLPGAAAWNNAKNYGTFNPDWKKVDMFSATNFVPNGFTRAEIEKYYRKAWMAFYFKPSVMWDYFKKLRYKNMRYKILKGAKSFLIFLLKRPVK